MNRRNAFTTSLTISAELQHRLRAVRIRALLLSEQLVGTWTYVSSTARLPDGSPLWGANPKSL